MGRAELIKLAKGIMGEPKSKEKKIRFKSTPKSRELMARREAQIIKYSKKDNGIDALFVQHKAAKLANDDVLADSIMDQIYFLSFRDSSSL